MHVSSDLICNLSD